MESIAKIYDRLKDDGKIQSIWDQIKDKIKEQFGPEEDNPTLEPIGIDTIGPDYKPIDTIGPDYKPIDTNPWDRIPGIPGMDIPDMKVSEPYLIQPVSNNIGLQGELDTDKTKQAFVNVAALTEIKSVADENGQYDAEKVEAATKDVADYYTARQALDAKFGKTTAGKYEMRANPEYDDKTQAAMDAGYEAALAELNKQYGEDTVNLYNKTQEKIEAYEKAEREKGLEQTIVPDGRGFKFVSNPDYDPDFAKNDPDLADVAYAKGQMSAADYKAASGEEYKSNDPEKAYVKTKDMSRRVDSFVGHIREWSMPELKPEIKNYLLDDINKGKETFADAVHSITASPAMVALGAKAFALKDAAVENGSKVFNTVENKLDDLTNGKFSNGVNMMRTAFSNVVETTENKAEQAKQSKAARGHEFDGQFSGDTGMEFGGLSQ